MEVLNPFYEYKTLTNEEIESLANVRTGAEARKKQAEAKIWARAQFGLELNLSWLKESNYLRLKRLWRLKWNL